MFQINGLFYETVGGVQIFQPANPAGGVPIGTEVTYQWLNDVQGELLNFLSAAGVSPAANTPTQVKQSTDILYCATAGGMNATNIGTSLTTTVTFTAPRDAIVLVNGNCGSTQTVTGLGMTTYTNATPLHQSSNWAGSSATNNAGSYTGLFSVAKGANVTFTMTMTVVSSATNSIGFNYVALPQP